MEYNEVENKQAMLWLAAHAPNYVLDYIGRRTEALRQAIKIIENMNRECYFTVEDLTESERHKYGK